MSQRVYNSACGRRDAARAPCEPPGQTRSPVLKSYLPILVFAFLGLTVGSAFAMLNHLIGPKRPKRPTAASRRQAEPYESGIPVEAARGFRFGVSFYLVAMLFILFDIEVVFMYPWAVVYRDMLADHATRNLILASMVSFLLILFAGYLYALKKKAFDWKS